MRSVLSASGTKTNVPPCVAETPRAGKYKEYFDFKQLQIVIELWVYCCIYLQLCLDAPPSFTVLALEPTKTNIT